MRRGLKLALMAGVMALGVGLSVPGAVAEPAKTEAPAVAPAEDPKIEALRAKAKTLEANNPAAARVVYEELLALSPDDLNANISIGIVLARTGDFERAQTIFTRVLDLAGSNTQVRAAAFGNLGVLAKIGGDLEGAIRYYEQALALNIELGDKEGMADNLGNIGVLAKKRGDLDGAMRYYEQAFALAKELGSKEKQAAVLANMGIVARTRGDFDGAMRFYEQALLLRQELGQKEGVAEILCSIGFLAEKQGTFPRARALYEQALAIYDEIGAGQGEFARFYRDRLAKLPPEGH